jgi:hypothetical protein
MLNAIVAPVYWAIPEIANSASGEAPAVNRAMPDERVPVVSAGQSNRSGSVRQISCHRGWKLSQPANGNPVCFCV